MRADWIVCATEGYTARLPGLRRSLLPLGSSMIVTEPLPADVWDEIGWDACETLLDGAHVYSYSQRTADGRIAIGGRGVPYRFGSGVDRNAECPPRDGRRSCARTLVALFPATARRARSSIRWAGVLGLARDWCASVDGRSRLRATPGPAATSATASARRTWPRARSSTCMLGRESDLVTLPWVGHTLPRASSPSRCASSAPARSTSPTAQPIAREARGSRTVPPGRRRVGDRRTLKPLPGGPFR